MIFPKPVFLIPLGSILPNSVHVKHPPLHPHIYKQSVSCELLASPGKFCRNELIHSSMQALNDLIQNKQKGWAQQLLIDHGRAITNAIV